MKRSQAFVLCLLALLCLALPSACRRAGPEAPAEAPSPPDAGPAPQTAPPLSSRREETRPTEPPEPQPEPEPEPEPEPQLEPEPSAPANTRLYILMYHDFVSGDGTGCNNWMLPASRFQENLQWLSDHGYDTVLPSQLAAGEPLPERAVMITMDDGYVSNYTLAYPILQQFGAKAVISLITKSVDEGNSAYLTWEMCREMSDSGPVELGSHTYQCHEADNLGIARRPGESREDYEERITADLQTSIDLIRSNTGAQVQFFAYPGGRVDKWSNDIIRELFSVTVTTKHGPADISNGLYQLRRHNISLAEDVTKFLPE